MGGAARSTHELAAVLLERDHHCATLMTSDTEVATIRRHKRILNLSVKSQRHQATEILRPAVEFVRSRIGAHRVRDVTRAYPAWTSALPENALNATILKFRPDIVVTNSIERPAWRQIRDLCVMHRIPTVFYIREASGVRHLIDPPSPPDLLLANAEAHAIEARVAGFDCAVVPSVVNTERSRVTSQRTHVVLVNPVPIYGVELAIEIAACCPEIPFTFVESWPLSDRERLELDDRCTDLGNCELLPFQADARNIYRHARAMLMLCTVPSRPRVIPEAQANGIPVVAVDRPGHGEAVGSGGILIDPQAPLTTWVTQLRRLWHDDIHYQQLCDEALRHASRSDATPLAVVQRFESLVEPLMTQSAKRRPLNRTNDDKP